LVEAEKAKDDSSKSHKKDRRKGRREDRREIVP